MEIQRRIRWRHLVMAVALGAAIWCVHAIVANDVVTAQSGVVPNVSVVFDPAVVEVGEPVKLVVTIDNRANADDGRYSLASTTVSPLFSDQSGTVTSDCDDGLLPWTNGSFNITNRTLTAGEICKITVEMGIAQTGTQSVVVDLTSADYGDVSAGPATVTVTDAPPLVVSMDFDPDTVLVGEETTLTIMIENPAYSGSTFSFSTSAISDVSNLVVFRDDCGGSTQETGNGGFETIGGASLPAQRGCSIEIILEFDEPGTKNVSIQDLASTFGTARASAQVVVTQAVLPTLSIEAAKTVEQGEYMTVIFTVDNTANTIPATDINIVARAIVGAVAEFVGSTCGGDNFTVGQDASFETHSRSVAAGETCTFTVRYAFPEVGDYAVNIANYFVRLGSISGGEDPDLQRIEVVEGVGPGIALRFTGYPITTFAPEPLQLAIDNRGRPFDVSDIDIAIPLVPGALIELGDSTCLGSTILFVADGSASLRDRVVPADTLCHINLNYIFSIIGEAEVNADATSSHGPSETASVTVMVELGVGATVTAEFATASTSVVDPVRLTITIDNSQNATFIPFPMFALSPVPEGTQIDNVEVTCPGLDYDAETRSFVFGRVDIVARSTCTIAADYLFDDPGDVVIDFDLTPSVGEPYKTSASVVVTPLGVCDGKAVTIDMNLGASGVGTAGDDVILGTPGDDVIDAGDGDDTVCAGSGDDVVVAGNGDDIVFGETGRDVLRGGPGVDMVDGGLGDDRVLGGIGDDTLIGGDGDDYIGGFGGADTITGGPGNEVIFGGFGADTIDGGPGNDVIRGLIGNDTIHGGDGNDRLDGDRGNDVIFGGFGDDVIGGGNANDILNGDSGDDIVNGGKADDTLSGGLGVDTCTGNLQNVADTADSTCETKFGIP